MVEHTHPGECTLIGLIVLVTLNTRFVSMSNAIQTSLEANHFRRQELLIICEERRPQTTVA